MYPAAMIVGRNNLEVAISGRNQVKTTEKDIDQWNVPEIKAERYATKKV
jgi:hypothetical protein